MTSRRRSTSVAFVVVAVGGVGGLVYSLTLPAGPAGERAPSASPLFASSFRDFDRTMQPLGQWRGRTTLVYFWATWCAPCVREVPLLIKLYEKYRSQNLEIVGIAVDQTDKVRKFTEQYRISYHVLIGGNDALNLSRKMGNGIGGLPFLVVIDRNAKVVATYLGELTEDWLERTVAPLLDNPGPGPVGG